MYLISMKRRMRLEFVASALLILAVLGFEASAQRPGSPGNPTRDMVRAINRQELDVLLLRKRLPSLTDERAKRLLHKEVNDDFTALQNLNNRMMRETWMREGVDYDFVSDMISQIRGKASRLKNSLNLPRPVNLPSEPLRYPTSDEEFRAALLILDRVIMRFVTNPVFQNSNTLAVNLARDARRDLESMIELTGALRKVAERLGRANNR